MSDYRKYFAEAYRQMLLEKDFDISQEVLDGIKDWKDADENHGLGSLEDIETLEIIDPDAFTQAEVEATDYIGKVILECVTCKHHISVDESEVYKDDELDTLCPNIECPVCGSTQGYTAFGKIEKYEAPEEEEEEEKLEFPEESDEDEVEEEEEVEEVKESLHDRIRRKHLQEAKKDVCPHCGKNPCVCEGKDCANCDESASEDLEDDLVEGWDKKKDPYFGMPYTKLLKQIMDAGIDPVNDYDPVKSIRRYLVDRTGMSMMQADKIAKKIEQNAYDIMNDMSESLDEGKDCADCDESCSKDESLNEALNNISLDTDDQHLDISADETGRISVVSEPTGAPAEDIPDTMVPGEESVVPLDMGDEEEIEANVNPEEQDDILSAEESDTELAAAEEPVEDEFGEEEFEVEEESFNYLGNTFAKKLYENVANYNVTGHSDKDGKLVIEGLITFNSGGQKPTTFIFENAQETKSGRIVLEGANKTFFPTNAFKLRGKLVEGKFISESLRYNYSINKLNESTGKQEPVAVRGIVRGK